MQEREWTTMKIRHMRSIALPLVFAVLLTAPGCMKDKALPPALANEGEVWLTADLRYGAQPFQSGQGYPYGQGRTLHLTTMKVLLSDFRMADVEGRLLGHFEDVSVLIDPEGPSTFVLGTMPAVGLGELAFQLGLHEGLDRLPAVSATWPLDRTDMFVDGDPARGRYVLRLEGFVDLDGDGVYSVGADTAFRYTPHGKPDPTRGMVQAPAGQQVIAGTKVDRELVLDVMLLLLGVDVLAHPVADGTDSVAMQIERNLSIALR